jgi:hypothetical protein
MDKPNQGDELTEDQIKLALNYNDFKGAQPEKGWHTGDDGVFEPWTRDFGYPEGKATYAGVTLDGKRYHIYFLNDGHQLPIILDKYQTPANYDVKPT